MSDADELAPLPVGRFPWERCVRDCQDITGGRMLTLLALGTYMMANGTRARPAVATLAERTGQHPGTVGRHLRWARQEGWLIQESRGHRQWNGFTVASVTALLIPLPLARLSARLCARL